MFKIEYIEILISVEGTDQITLHTNLPNTFPQIPDQGNMKMSIDLQHGTAIKYIRENFVDNPDFPATATLIDGKLGTKTVIDIVNYEFHQ